ncbi:beta-arrestin-1-like isoform X2 [Acanthaster planci]|uniref:Beta-arrestin-1-like isoform X2 n=1 Tax=Acanthaster planci TaxID=133434 RepID=A0A8B7YKE2_ACAPL|nr:beta-arrestin-1-like isoform X2 [Acanthaster planci]
MTTIVEQLLASADDHHHESVSQRPECPMAATNTTPKTPPATSGNQTTNGPAAGGDCADNKKQGTRVFKKSCPNGKITTYLGKRDFLDHMIQIDPIDGVVLVDTEYVKNRKVFVHVLAAFRYGREDLDVLGLTFRKDLYLASMQVYPPIPEEQKPLTRLQERLIKKLGSNAYPFLFQLPENSPASVTLQPSPEDREGKPCGVDYELRTYVGDSIDEKPHKRNSVNLAIRKVTYANPEMPIAQPSEEVTKTFIMSTNSPLHLEASLDKGMYFHGEKIAVNIQITNNSKREVKKIKILVKQYADICLFNKANYKCCVAYFETDKASDGLPVLPSHTLSKVFYVTPLLANNKHKRGLALDGKLKHEDTNLATSTMFKPCEKGREDAENIHGIVVQYKVKCSLDVPFSRPLSVLLPFILTHPKPEQPAESFPAPPNPEQRQQKEEALEAQQEALDTNLINFDTKNDPNRRAGKYCVGQTYMPGMLNPSGVEPATPQDDDLIFEDFARLRLQGAEGEGTEA